MERRLLTMAAAQGGVFSAPEAMSVGVTGNDLTALVRGGELVRFRRGAYALRVLAVMRSRPRSDRASHHSALALLDIPFVGAPLDHVFAESHVGGRRTTGGLHLHSPTSSTGLRVGGIRLVTPEVACAQVAARFGFEAGVCAMDGALHRRRCTRGDLEVAVEQLPTRRRGPALRAIAVTDPRTESVGESRTRIILCDAGFSVLPQAVLEDGSRFVARVDFLVDDCVVVEFDGLVKYEGLSGRAALAAEKDRESRISRLGYEVVRIVWGDLADPPGIVRRVLAARRTARARRVAMGR